MTRIYAIHTGSYSDQRWGPVFSTAAKALKYKAAFKDPDAEVEVYVIDNEQDTGLVYPEWLIVFNTGGDVISSTQEEDPAPYEPLLHKNSTRVIVPPRDNHWYFLDAPGIRETAALVVRFIHAPDLKHAVKIAADKRREFLAAPSRGSTV